MEPGGSGDGLSQAVGTVQASRARRTRSIILKASHRAWRKSREKKSSAQTHRISVRHQGTCWAEEKDHAPLARLAGKAGPRRQGTYAASTYIFRAICPGRTRRPNPAQMQRRGDATAFSLDDIPQTPPPFLCSKPDGGKVGRTKGSSSCSNRGGGYEANSGNLNQTSCCLVRLPTMARSLVAISLLSVCR
jgi:hypothetical protein